MSTILLIDFGSTFTKGVMINLEDEEIVAQSSVPQRLNRMFAWGWRNYWWT